MPGATMTSVDAITKEVYEGRIETQLQNEVTTTKRIERTSDGVVETVGGKYVDFPIKVQRNQGIGNRLEGELMQAAGRQGYAEVHVPLYKSLGRVNLTSEVMQLADKNYQAFASAMDREMEGLKEDLGKDQNRQAQLDGTGLLASITAADAAVNNTVTVDNTQYIEVGMVIDIRNRTTGAATVANRNVTAVNEVAKTVTFDGPGSVDAATDGIYREGNFAGGIRREISGWDAIVSDTKPLHGLDPALQSKWKAVVQGNGGVLRALSEGLMIETCDKIRTNGGKVTAIFTNLGVRRAYFNLLSQQRRYTDTKTFAGGFQGLPFNYGTEIPVVEEVDHRPNSMHFITEPAVKIYRNRPWHWADEDGNVWKWVTGYDVFEAYMRMFSEWGTDRRNAHGILADLIEG